MPPLRRRQPATNQDSTFVMSVSMVGIGVVSASVMSVGARGVSAGVEQFQRVEYSTGRYSCCNVVRWADEDECTSRGCIRSTSPAAPVASLTAAAASARSNVNRSAGSQSVSARR